MNSFEDVWCWYHSSGFLKMPWELEPRQYGIRFMHTRIRTDISPYMVIMRQGLEKGLWKNGVKGFGDLIGEMAARHVNWEYPYQQAYQSDRFIYPNPQTLLQTVPDRPGWFAPGWAMTPGQYGYNVIRLIPQQGAREVAVAFEGIFESRKYSDWRASIIAIDGNNEARYSPMFNKGRQKLELRPSDRVYLTVAATPLGYTAFNGFNALYTKPQYPYEVSFQGCLPAQEMEWGSLARQYPHRDAYPPDPATDEGRRHIAEMQQSIETASREIARIEGLMKGPLFDPVFLNSLKAPWTGPRDEYQRRLANARGHRHPNGGGWVADQAHADESAYVGPHAYVLDKSKVTGNARLTGHAMLIDAAEVSGNALVGDFGVVGQNVRVSENAHVLGHATLLRSGDIRGNAVIRGTSDVAATSEPKGKDFAATGCVVFDHAAWVRGDHAYDDGRIAGKAEDIPDPAAKSDSPAGNKYLYANWEFKYPSESVLYDSFFNTVGFLRGAPAFGTDGARTIATFDGKQQYAVTSWDVTSWTRAIRRRPTILPPGGMARGISRGGPGFLPCLHQGPRGLCGDCGPSGRGVQGYGEGDPRPPQILHQPRAVGATKCGKRPGKTVRSNSTTR
ncbi:MAG: DUF6055 domain-containing protein [Verrucomicrobia bacterium]|nr:DUF6055 domain-containing protein [Verrucomicrobiota bacterium]